MSTTRRVRVAGACLLGFAVLFFTNMALTDVPDIVDSDAAAVDFYAIAGNQSKAVAAFYVLIAVIVCFLALLGALLPLARSRGRDGLASAAWMSGGAFVGLYLAGGGLFLVPTATVALGFGESPEVDPAFARYASTLGDAFLLLAAPVALGACLALTCRAAHAIRALPGWVAFAGYAVAGLLAVGGWTWFPLPLLVLWALVAGVRLVFARASTAVAEPVEAATLVRT